MTFSSLIDALSGKLLSWVERAVEMLPNVALALLVALAFGVGARWVERLVKRVIHRLSSNAAICDLLGSVARIATVLVGLFIALGLLQLERTVTSLLAGVGVIGLALGFAFQDIAANFMSGVLMALRRPFAIGDLIEVDDARGEVEKIELRATTLTTLSGLSVIIPNKDVYQSKIVNYTRTRERRVELAVGVAYSDDLRRAREVALAALQDSPGRDPSREVEVYYTGFGESSIDLTVRFWLAEPDERSYLRARSEAVIRIKAAFDERGLTIPFPIRTLDFGAAAVGGESMGELVRMARERSA